MLGGRKIALRFFAARIARQDGFYGPRDLAETDPAKRPPNSVRHEEIGRSGSAALARARRECGTNVGRAEGEIGFLGAEPVLPRFGHPARAGQFADVFKTHLLQTQTEQAIRGPHVVVEAHRPTQLFYVAARLAIA